MKKILPLLLCSLLLLTACVKESPEPIYTPPAVAPEDRKAIRTTDSGGISYTLYNDNTCEIVEADPETYDSSSLSLPDFFDKYTVIAIADEVFRGASFTNVTLPQFLVSIGDRAFEHSQLTELSLPNTLKELGEEAFANCIRLEKLSLSASLQTISTGAFFGCSALSELVIPEGIEEIGEEAFGNNSALTVLSLPESLKTIDAYAFWHCGNESLSIKIPEGVKSVGANAFRETAWLKEQTAEWVVVGDGVLLCYNGSAPTAVIPETVRYLSNAFDTSPAKEVTLPASLEGIARDAFAESGVEKVYYSGENTAVLQALEGLL